MEKRSDLDPLIRQEWLKQPTNRRTENDILDVYGLLQNDRPDLLSFKASGDKYQILKSILSDLISR